MGNNDNSNDLIEQTTTEQHLVEFELQLNNQEQFISENEEYSYQDEFNQQNQSQIVVKSESCDEQEEIAEDIILESSQSLNDNDKLKNNKVQENLRRKLQ